VSAAEPRNCLTGACVEIELFEEDQKYCRLEPISNLCVPCCVSAASSPRHMEKARGVASDSEHL